MASSLPTQLAETIQTAHINRHPSPTHDINPSTAAEKIQPLSPRHEKHDSDVASIDGRSDGSDLLHDDEDGYQSLAPRRRRATLPPLPDLRFEQSYLHSIANAQTWYKVALITVLDQVMMPLAQGLLYNLALCGWQYWNQTARIHGDSAGARLRRWWYGVNNWQIPPERRKR